jgi:holo-[acyl-carrier protein] synthase
MIRVGIDIVELARMRSVIERFRERFLRRIFTEAEIAFCVTRSDPYQSYGVRFAAKEAILKALGTGKSGGIRWKDMEILDDEHSRPCAQLYGKVRQLTKGKLHLSLSHTSTLAIAVCILED